VSLYCLQHNSFVAPLKKTQFSLTVAVPIPLQTKFKRFPLSSTRRILGDMVVHFCKSVRDGLAFFFTPGLSVWHLFGCLRRSRRRRNKVGGSRTSIMWVSPASRRTMQRGVGGGVYFLMYRHQAVVTKTKKKRKKRIQRHLNRTSSPRRNAPRNRSDTA